MIAVGRGLELFHHAGSDLSKYQKTCATCLQVPCVEAKMLVGHGAKLAGAVSRDGVFDERVVAESRDQPLAVLVDATGQVAFQRAERHLGKRRPARRLAAVGRRG